MSSLGPIPQRLALPTLPCVDYISRGNTGGLKSPCNAFLDENAVADRDASRHDPPPDRPNPPARLVLALTRRSNDGAGWLGPIPSIRGVGRFLGELRHEARDLLDPRVSSEKSRPHDHCWFSDAEVAADGPREAALHANPGIQHAEELPGRHVKPAPDESAPYWPPFTLR